MRLTFIQFFILGFASFRITHLIVFDKITAFLRAPFFDEFTMKDEDGNDAVYIAPKKSGVRGWIGELLSCYWCTGIWVSIALFLSALYFPKWAEPVIIIFAIAGVASLIESAVQKWGGE
ncbi:DUF1360 domain-containing protein [Falsibacillus pallidus]|uniref:Uncharacterized protein DUF1360 n=1 Tax=Falsibacillus pallidus TaxID=493781 RepID=A0A370H118_9BACI|nr:DUF1360 domain-containing protein [Falsibacillus pallidus]RDI47743.1 uncharacterized protein DUF1360 [Falsibacillus pallidus]